MGQSGGNTFAFEILSYYPNTAISEVLKILSFVFLVFLFLQLSIRSLAKRKAGIVLSLFGLAYLLCFFSSLFSYPALYQEFLTPSLNKSVFLGSKYLHPDYLKILAICVFFLSSFFILSRLAKVGVLFLTLSFLYFQFQQSFISPIADAKEKNIILIGIDSLRSDSIRKDLVPNIFALKEDPNTISFNDHIIGIPRTFPSWMEILHGEYSAHTGIRHMFPGLLQQRKQTDSLVSVLKDNGFQTAVISDFAGDIFPRFNSGYNKIYTPNFTLHSLTRMTIDQSFPLFLPLITSSALNRFFPDLRENPCFSDPELLVSESIQHLNSSHQKNFLSIFFSNAHFPYAAPWPWYSKRSDPNYAGPYFFKKDPDLSQSHEINESDIQQIRNLYHGSLSAIDESLGRLFKHLKEQKMWDNSIIVITADHGEDLFEFERVQGHGEHLRGENVLKVPLLVKTLDRVDPSRKNAEFTSRMIDLAPTLLSFLDLKLKKTSGHDLHLWIKGKNEAPKLDAYSETEIWFSRTGNAFFQKERLDYPSIAGLLNLDPGGTGSVILNSRYEKVINAAKHRSLINGSYKLIYTPTDKGAHFKLFDRTSDPQNVRDISLQNPQIFKRMKESLITQILNLEQTAKFVDNYVVPY